MISLKELILNEYSEKTITTTIDRWKNTNPNLDTNIARQVIQRFDQVKSGLSTKLQQIALSDELKQGQNYLNIDKYSWEDMVNLLRSLPEKDDKVKKDAINKFVQEERMDKGTVTSYVIRFMNNRRNLKYALDNGTEDGNYSKEEVKKLIPSRLIPNNLYLDPRAYNFQQLENLLDTLFPMNVEVGADENNVTTDADKVYESNGIEIYKGDSQHKCISYNPTVGTKKKYGWCIAQPSNQMYDRYRFMEEGRNRMFYFVFDRTKTSEPEHKPFKDPWHSFVIHVGEGNRKYWITDADNDFEKEFSSWSDLQKIAPEVWKRIGGLESIFKFIAPSKAEISGAAMRGKRLSAQDFRELDYEDKQQYVQSNAGSLSKEILEILDKELKNLAINYGQKFPYSLLKDNESLAKRYAIFRFRHTNYGNEAIPLPYVKYLDEDAKEKYLTTFDGNLTFELIEKYFGPQSAEKYVQEQIQKLDFIPQNALKYIKDPKIKKLYEVYSSLFKNWEFENDTDISDEELANKESMPAQSVTPKPLIVDDWKELSSSKRKTIIDLAKKFTGNEEYLIVLYSVPFVINDGDRDLVLLPVNLDDFTGKWYLMDINGMAIDEYNGENTTLGSIPLYEGYPNFNDGDFTRVYNIDDVKVQKEINEYKFLAEIKINKPQPLLIKTIELYKKKYSALEQGFDGYLKEWVENNIVPLDHEYWDNPEMHIYDTFKDLSPQKLNYLYDFLKTYKPIEEGEIMDLDEIRVNNPLSLYSILTSPNNLKETLSEIGYHYGTYGDLKGLMEFYEEEYNKSWDEIRDTLKKIYKEYEDQIEEWTDDDLDEIKINTPSIWKDLVPPQNLKVGDELRDYNDDKITLIKAVPWKNRQELQKYDYGGIIDEFESEPELYDINNNVWLIAGTVVHYEKTTTSVWIYREDGAFKKIESFKEQFLKNRLISRAGLK